MADPPRGPGLPEIIDSVTPEHAEQYRVLRGHQGQRLTLDQARCDLVDALERAHYVRTSDDGLQQWRGPQPLRLRFLVRAGALVSVHPGIGPLSWAPRRSISAVSSDTLPWVTEDKPTRGRPRRTPSASTEVFQIRCTPEEKERWRAKAALAKLELAEVMRRLLDRWERGEVRLGK